MRRRLTIDLRKVDFPLMAVTVILACFGLVMVFSASYYYSITTTGSPFSYLLKDAVMVALGVAAMFMGTVLDYRVYDNTKFVVFVVAVCLLLLVGVLTPLGENVNGATRWIKLAPGVTIMPGECAKAGAVCMFAWYYGNHPEGARHLRAGTAVTILIALAFAALIYKQPNLSTAVTLCGVCILMLLAAGMKWKYFFFLVAAGAAGVLGILFFSDNTYMMDRFHSFSDPFADASGDGYQAVQSLYALAGGGLGGVGLGKSVQKSLYLPEPHNDFILSIIGEELGFVGVMVLMALYCIYIWRGIKIALHAKDQFGMLIASGTVIMVAVQVILNVAIVTASMPATGVNLPFISYGGNALIIFMFLSGVMLNISKGRMPSASKGRDRELMVKR